MSIQVSPETQAWLADQARRQGVSVEALLEQLLTERRAARIARDRPAPELPTWHLGGSGSLHRRDLYDDVR
jgi:hypothetical protein